MNILLVTLFSLERNTSVAISNINITKGLLALGHRVTWVMPNWPQCETELDASQVRIVRVPGQDQPRDAGWVLNKLRSHFGFLDFTRSYLREVRNTHVPDEYFDFVISTSDPKTSHVFTKRLLKHVRYGKWIQHWGDPLLGDITRNFWWPEWCIKLYEGRILRKADKIVYVTPFTAEAQKKAYPQYADKITFVPLPADMHETKTVSEKDKLKVAYLGDYNPMFRNLRPLYDACKNLDYVQLTIAGHGPNYGITDNITILPRIPQDQALKIEGDADVIFCVCNMRGTQIPGKILYKTSSDKHILVAVEQENRDEMVKYFESFKRFVVCDNTKDSIAAALESLKNKEHDYTTPECLLPINVARRMKVIRYTKFADNPHGDGGSKRSAQIEEYWRSKDVEFVDEKFVLPKHYSISQAFVWVMRSIRFVFGDLRRLSWGGKSHSLKDLRKIILTYALRIPVIYDKYKGQNVTFIWENTNDVASLYLMKAAGAKIIGYPHNLESLVPTQHDPVTHKQAPYWLYEEIERLKLCDEVYAISKEETWLLQLFGVNAKYYPYYPPKVVELELLEIKKKRFARIPNEKKQYLILGSATNPPTRMGMQRLIDYFEQQKNVNYTIHVAGYNTETLSVGGGAIVNHGTVSMEKLNELLITTDGIIIYQPTTSGALTRIVENRMAGIPIYANFGAARDFYNLSDVHVYNDIEELNNLL